MESGDALHELRQRLKRMSSGVGFDRLLLTARNGPTTSSEIKQGVSFQGRFGVLRGLEWMTGSRALAAVHLDRWETSTGKEELNKLKQNRAKQNKRNT